jgi:hypothetical protein
MATKILLKFSSNNIINIVNIMQNNFLFLGVNVFNLHRIDLDRKYYTHLQREIEKEEGEKEWKNYHSSL